MVELLNYDDLYFKNLRMNNMNGFFIGGGGGRAGEVDPLGKKGCPPPQHKVLSTSLKGRRKDNRGGGCTKS